MNNKHDKIRTRYITKLITDYSDYKCGSGEGES